MWRWQVFADQAGERAPAPNRDPLARTLASVAFHTHSANSPVTVKRFAIGSQAAIRRGSVETCHELRFVDQAGEPMAVGFEQEVDGIRFDLRLPEEALEICGRPDVLRSVRAAVFAQRVVADVDLRAAANENPFRLNRLAEVFIAALLSKAVNGSADLPTTAAEFACPGGIQSLVEMTMTVLDENDPTTPLVDQLAHLWQDDVVRGRIAVLADVLWANPDTDLLAAARERLYSTLGHVMLDACVQLVPDAPAGDLLLDLDPGPAFDGSVAQGQPDARTVWLTEPSPGGIGLVEAIRRHYLEDPRRFFGLVENALAPSDLEVAEREMARALRRAGDCADLASAFSDVRQAVGHTALSEAQQALLAALTRHHVLATRPTVTALAARVLRPGSSLATERQQRQHLTSWEHLEAASGLEVDLRTYCAVAAAPADAPSFGELYNLLWPRGGEVRRAALQSWQPYTTLPPPDSLPLRLLWRQWRGEVDIARDDWHAEAQATLADRGTVGLFADWDHLPDWRSAVLRSVSTALAYRDIELHPYVSRTEHRPEGLLAVLHLREAPL